MAATVFPSPSTPTSRRRPSPAGHSSAHQVSAPAQRSPFHPAVRSQQAQLRLVPTPDLTAVDTRGLTASAGVAARPSRRRLPSAVYWRRRIFVGLVAATIVALALIIGQSFIGSTVDAATPPAAYVVQSGDTLWGISQQMHLRGDRRDVVQRLDAIAGGPLRAGQTLLIPGELLPPSR